MNSITTRTKRTLSGLIAALFALSLVAVPSAALAAAPFFGADPTNWNQSVTVGEGLTALTAFDPDGDALTFSTGGGLPDGITLNADGTFSGVATTAGSFGALNSVCDPFAECDMATLTVTVSAAAPINQAPSFGADPTNTSQSVAVGEGLTALTAFDPDGDPLTFSTMGGLPDGIALNADGTFSGVATTAGSFGAWINLCDPSTCVGDSLTVTVSAGAANTSPFFTPDSTNYNQSIAVGEGLVALTAFDPDGDPLTFSTMGGLPEGITLNADGTFSGVATTAGNFGAWINLCDPSTCVGDTLTVTVSAEAPSNQAPSFGMDSTNTFQAVAVGQGLTALTAFDPDGDVLTFSLIGGGLPPGITLNADGTFSGVTPDGDFTAMMGIQVCDPLAECATTSLYVISEGPSTNQAPFFTSDPTNTFQGVTGGVGRGLTALTAFDPDGDLLTFSTAGGLPEGITLNVDGTFSGVVTITNVTYTITAVIRVCDPLGLCDITTLTVMVSRGANNESGPSTSPTPSPSASPVVTPTPQPSSSPIVTPSPQPKASTLSLANTSMEGSLGGTPAQMQILLGLLLLSLGAGQLASKRLRRRFLRQR